MMLGRGDGRTLRERGRRKVRRVARRWRRSRSTRRRVPRALGVAGLLAALDEQGIRYVVLRWFEDLPDVEDGEDLDILVSDRDAPRLDALLTRSAREGEVLCDVYSVTGLPTFTWHGTAYYPPHVGRQILDRATRHRSGAWVPSPVDHFRSLAFHALYHKGHRSGLPLGATAGPRGLGAPEHAYVDVLQRLARELGIDVPITLADLDDHLAGRGWRPPLDTLLKWSEPNPWCADLYASELSSVAAPPGLAVLLVRARAGDPESVCRIRHHAERAGFRIVAVRGLDHAAVRRARTELRGANWGAGPHPRSGGDPHTALVLVDPAPIAPTPSQLAAHPGLDNGRLRTVKLSVRDWWNGNHPPEERCNVLHSSDNARQAAHYLEVLFGEESATLLARAAATVDTVPEVASLP